MSNLKLSAFTGLLAVCGAANAQVGGGGPTTWTLMDRLDTISYYTDQPLDSQSVSVNTLFTGLYIYDAAPDDWVFGSTMQSPPNWGTGLGSLGYQGASVYDDVYAIPGSGITVVAGGTIYGYVEWQEWQPEEVWASNLDDEESRSGQYFLLWDVGVIVPGQ